MEFNIRSFQERVGYNDNNYYELVFKEKQQISPQLGVGRKMNSLILEIGDIKLFKKIVKKGGGF